MTARAATLSLGLLGLLGLIGLASPSWAAEAGPARFVVVVGHNGGGDDAERPTLKFADDDAARMYLQLHRGADRAWLLTTFDAESAGLYAPLTQTAEPPSRRALARVLGEATWLIRDAKSAGRATELVFYFAGHGDVSAGGEGFVVLSDGAFTRTDLARQVVMGSPADLTHIILDACASYLMVSRGEAEAAPVELSPELLGKLDTHQDTSADAWARTGVFVSTSSAAEVHESPAVGGGVFSYLLRSALVGGGDVNADGRVEYVEAEAFVASASAAIEDPRARLNVFARPPAQRPHAALGDLNAGAEAFLLVDSTAARHLRILDSRGQPYAELHKGEGTTPYVALIGHPFFRVREGDREALLIPRRAGAYALSSLSFDDAPLTRGGAGPFTSLYRLPYGQAFLTGFLSRTQTPPPLAGTKLEVAFAPDGAPPFEMPWGVLAGVTAAGGAVLLMGAAAALVGNAVSFGMLEQRFRQTGTLDPALSLQADGFMTGALVLGVGGGAVLAGAGGLTVVWMVGDE